MEEITQEQFDEMLADFAEENWKVKQLLDRLGYDEIPIHLRKEIDNVLGVERRVVIFKK